MTRTAYLAGYAGRTPQQLLDAVKRLETPANLPDGKTPDIGAKIVDIRFSPTSPNPLWRFDALRSFLRWRYYGCRALGNANYRPQDRNKGIVIPHLAVGLADLDLIPPVVPVVLLCACAETTTCHRKVLGDDLSRRGWDVRELEWPSPVQAALFHATPDQSAGRETDGGPARG